MRPVQEFTTIQIDEPDIRDTSASPQQLSPALSQRMWEQQAEDNVIERLSKAGLLAPVGDVDKVLDTVVRNLQITNNLNIEPAVKTRVLLTSPLDSMAIGRTITLSRGSSTSSLTVASPLCRPRRRNCRTRSTVSDAWVINASPLILFARIARLDLFERLAPQIIVPGAVFEEVRAGQGKDTTAASALSWAALRRSSWVGGHRDFADGDGPQHLRSQHPLRSDIDSRPTPARGP